MGRPVDLPELQPHQPAHHEHVPEVRAVNALSQGIYRLYFDYRPAAGHVPDCSRVGTDVWEVTRFTRENLHGELTEVTYRLACGECGIAKFVTFDGDPSWESTHAGEIGFGSKPERVSGLWLHAGPRMFYGDKHGPWEFLVTRGKERPREPGDVDGMVGWKLGKRGGVRWWAGLGLTDNGKVRTIAGRDFGSRRAAVGWIAAALPEGDGR